MPAILDIWYREPGRRRWPAAVRRGLTVRELPFRLAAHRRAGARHLLPHPPMSRRTRGDATGTRAPPVPVRARPQHGRFLFRPSPSTARRSPGGTVTVSVRVCNTSDREAAEVVQLYLHQRHGSAPDRSASSKASNASPWHPRRPSRCSSRSVPSTGATGAPPNGLGPRSIFDVWVGGSLSRRADHDLRGAQT